MGQQRTFAELAWTQKGKVTKRERFLGEMNAVIPWKDLIALIEPHYPKGDRGRPTLGIEKMLRIYFLQQWFDLSDPLAEETIYDSESMRRFVGIDLSDDVVPDESSILRFRHLLEAHQLTEAIFTTVRQLLAARGILLQTGTIVDATILTAPSSTKNAARKRDPEMASTKKGTTYYFGMKVHVGTDRHGLVHSLATTPAAAADVQQLPDLVHGAERALYGDRAYWSESDRQACRAAGIAYRVNRRSSKWTPLSPGWRAINTSRSRVRAYCEYPFRVVKQLWGFRKVRYRGLAKNTARVFAIFALANLYLARRRLGAAGATCL